MWKTFYRYVGAPDGWKYDTLTLFEGSKFSGYDQYSYGDKYSLQYKYFGRSVAVTGCTPWTLYQHSGYNGACVCVYPKDQYTCQVGLYPDLEYFNDNVSSIRRGCYCSYSKYPPWPWKIIHVHDKEKEDQKQIIIVCVFFSIFWCSNFINGYNIETRPWFYFLKELSSLSPTTGIWRET